MDSRFCGQDGAGGITGVGMAGLLRSTCDCPVCEQALLGVTEAHKSPPFAKGGLRGISSLFGVRHAGWIYSGPRLLIRQSCHMFSMPTYARNVPCLKREIPPTPVRQRGALHHRAEDWTTNRPCVRAGPFHSRCTRRTSHFRPRSWIPAFAGMTVYSVGLLGK